MRKWLVGPALFFLVIDSLAAAPREIVLDISPRLCVVPAGAAQCAATVHARWHASEPESLCLVILGHRDVKQCWEHYAEGMYDVELEFSADLVLQLRDPQLQQVLASETLRVIHEALQYRHRRRQPWNIFD
ncbi:MAG: DUF3019 domain-containing protein [Proteobacteria bacterium]|nr:DUF3019 domain-containing protein [Pseudomonadota bacterium]